MMAAVVLAANLALASNPQLGIAEGQCRPNEPGPAFIVTLLGLKDRQGSLKLEVYPSNNVDFLADDNLLLSAGKVFRRVVMPVPGRGPPQLCIRVPRAGPYSLSLLHDRDDNRKFNFASDGIGFPNNPTLHWSKPRAEATRAIAGPGRTALVVRLNYRRGLAGFGPLKEGDAE